MIICSEIAGEITEEGKFNCAVCKKTGGNTSNLCQFCRCMIDIAISELNWMPGMCKLANK